ncbi:MAG: ISAzo13 family transposase, partial [Actinomycetales bacterium]
MSARLAVLLPRLNERDRRLALAVEANAWGYGGITAVHRACGASKTTIIRGQRELVAEAAGDSTQTPGRVRAPGGGRKRAEVADPELPAALDALIEPGTRGDPESPLRWTTKSTRHLAAELTRSGHRVTHSVVAKILRAGGYSLQGTRKTLEGAQHPDRDAQFRYIHDAVEAALAAGEPVISVDTKKKELIGRFTQAGQEWHRSGEPVAVNTHDFPSSADGKAIPYGVYDIADDSAWVSVGVDHDTSTFAVATIKTWWDKLGKAKYPNATTLLITCDGGGSNGHRPWLWKHELARLAAETGLTITVAHYPPGTSKWNKIEHRLFSRITGNWRGR